MGLFNFFKDHKSTPKTEVGLITNKKNKAEKIFFIKYKTLFLISGIILLSSIWLIAKGMNNSNDLGFHLGRIKGLSKTIQDGDFLAPIHNHFYGYGYATGLFYSNFYFYIPAVLSILGIPYMISFKVLCVLINIITTLSIYYCLKSITKDNKVAIIGTILYMFSSYRLCDIYSRCAMGEILSFMIIPLVILGLYEIVYRDYKKWYLFTTGFVLLILCHLISTFLLAIFVLIFILCNYKKFLEDKNRIKYLIISGIVGLLLGGFFLFPILEQKLNGNINIFLGENSFFPQNTTTSLKKFLIQTHFHNPYLGYSLILLLPIRCFIRKKEIAVQNKNLLNFADLFLILSMIAWISTTKIFPWNLVGNTLNFIQFPYRLLIISTTFLTFSYSIYFKLLTNAKVKKYAYLIAITISFFYIIIYSAKYAIGLPHYDDFDDNNIGNGEYLPYKTNIETIKSEEPIFKTNNDTLEFTYNKKGTTVYIDYKNNYEKNTYIEAPLLNYLGYKVEGADLENGTNNTIRLLINKEEGNIKVSYGGTKVQKLSYLISFVTLVGLTVYIIKEKKHNISKLIKL